MVCGGGEILRRKHEKCASPDEGMQGGRQNE